MPEDETNVVEPSERRCEKCGGDLHLLTILPRTSEHPAFRILECVSCNFLNWVAEKIA